MQYHIVASDLDGTLLGADGTVSSENWRAIEQMQAMGVQFVPASGRAFDELPPELVNCPLIRYYITSDGASIHDKQTGITHEIAMPQDLTRHVLNHLQQYPVCMMIHANTASYVDERTHHAEDYASYNMNRSWITFCLRMEATVPDLPAYACSLPCVQSVVPFFRHMEDLQSCKAYFEQDPRLIVAQSDPYNLEIFSSAAGKGNALMHLADLLSVPRDSTIAVGDSTNDLTMIQAAGLGLAMSNAVPEAKEAADVVICSNREHSARYILEHYLQPGTSSPAQ